jgi:hypothetical protein
MRFPRFSLECHHNDRTILQELVEARAEILVEARRAANFERRLNIWRDGCLRMEKRWREAQDTAGAATADVTQHQHVLAQALDELKESTNLILYLEGELTDMTRSRDELSEMADCLRNDLKKAKERKRS